MPDLNQTFMALSDDTRRQIVARLAGGETALSTLAAPFNMSQTAVSKHVRVLSDAGLVTVAKRGRTRYCRLEATPMRAAVNWMNDYRQFWENNLTALASYLDEETDT